MKNELANNSPITNLLLEKIDAISDEINSLDEDALVKEVKPTDNLKRLRVRFTYEMIEAQRDKRKISVQSICQGVIHPNHWSRVINNEHRLAYITRPLPSIAEEFHILQNDFMSGLKKISNVDPLRDSRIKISEWLSAAKVVLDRTNPVVQKIHQFNESKSGKDENKKESISITDRIKLLEESLGKKDK